MMSYGKEYVSVKVGTEHRKRIEELMARYELVMGITVKRHFILKQLIENGFAKMEAKLRVVELENAPSS